MDQLSPGSWDPLAAEEAGTLRSRCGEEDRKRGEGGTLAVFCLVAMTRAKIIWSQVPVVSMRGTIFPLLLRACLWLEYRRSDMVDTLGHSVSITLDARW